MSLTSHLRNPESPLRKFFADRFPNTRSLLKELRPTLNNAPCIKPPEKAPYGTLGHAFEFRVRLFFTKDDLTAAVPPYLVRYLETWPFDVTLNNVFQDLAIRHYQSEIQKSLSQPRNQEQERRLVRYCFAFAWLEELYRGGGAVWRYSPLIKEKPKSLKTLLAMPKPELVEDVCLMANLFEKQASDWIQRPVTLDPKLKGGTSIGGADPDLVLAQELIDLKTSSYIKAERFKRWVYQLIGYTLLDYDNRYAISRLTFYFARYGIRISWPFPEILNTLSEDPLPALTVLKKDLKKTIAKTSK